MKETLPEHLGRAEGVAGSLGGCSRLGIAVLEGFIQHLAGRTPTFEENQRPNRVAPHPGIDIAA